MTDKLTHDEALVEAVARTVEREFPCAAPKNQPKLRFKCIAETAIEAARPLIVKQAEKELLTELLDVAVGPETTFVKWFAKEKCGLDLKVGG